MHNYEHRVSSNLLSLINYFLEYEYTTDSGCGIEYPTSVTFLEATYKDTETAIDNAEDKSYWSGTSIAIAKVVPNKTTKAFDTAFRNFLDKRKDYITFEKNLTISYGRKSSKVTCPNCKSMINLQYGRRFKECPVCHSKEIISESNWKTLAAKKTLMEKASISLQKEAEKCGVSFVAAIGWHS